MAKKSKKSLASNLIPKYAGGGSNASGGTYANNPAAQQQYEQIVQQRIKDQAAEAAKNTAAATQARVSQASADYAKQNAANANPNQSSNFASVNNAAAPAAYTNTPNGGTAYGSGPRVGQSSLGVQGNQPSAAAASWGNLNQLPGYSEQQQQAAFNLNLQPQERMINQGAVDARGLENQAANNTTQASNFTQALQNQALGKSPSLATAQLKAASDRTLAQQLGAAAALRGGNAGANQRALMQSQAAAGQQLGQQAAATQIQEQQAAAQNAIAAQGATTNAQNAQAAVNQLYQSYITQGMSAAQAQQQATKDYMTYVAAQQQAAAGQETALQQTERSGQFALAGSPSQTGLIGSIFKMADGGTAGYESNMKAKYGPVTPRDIVGDELKAPVTYSEVLRKQYGDQFLADGGAAGYAELLKQKYGDNFIHAAGGVQLSEPSQNALNFVGKAAGSYFGGPIGKKLGGMGADMISGAKTPTETLKEAGNVNNLVNSAKDVALDYSTNSPSSSSSDFADVSSFAKPDTASSLTGAASDVKAPISNWDKGFNTMGMIGNATNNKGLKTASTIYSLAKEWNKADGGPAGYSKVLYVRQMNKGSK